MRTIAKLFGKSPFTPLQSHMEKVAACMEKLPSLFSALEHNDPESIQKISDEISKLEHEADLTKNDIRNHLPKSLFLPIDRGDLLEILSLQDCLADKAEDIGILLTLRKLECYEQYKETFSTFYKKNLAAFDKAHEIIHELDNLLESSFGGVEAQKVKQLVKEVAFIEYEADCLQHRIVKDLYQMGDTLPYPVFHMWLTLVKEVSALSNLSEKLGNRIRMMLELQ